MKRCFLFLMLFGFLVEAHAVAGVKTLAKELAESLAESLSRKGGRELAEYGGEKALKESLERVAKESGEATARKLARYGDAYGLEAFKTLARNPDLFIKALDDVPPGLQAKALRALQRNGDEVTEALTRFGPEALEVAAKHSGVGSKMILELGDEIVPVARHLNERQFMKLAQHADDIAKLPATEKKRLLAYVLEHPTSLLTLTLGTGGGILLVTDGKEMLFGLAGVDEVIEVDEHGNRTVKRKGPVDKILDRWPILALLLIIVCGFKALPSLIRARRS